MDIDNLNIDFAKIAELYQMYKDALSIGNNNCLVEQLKDKIVVTFWKTIRKAKSVTTEMKEYSDLIVNKIIYCLKKYPNKNPEDFCKLTYVSIMKILKAKADLDSFENLSGMHITDSENRLRKKIENAYKQFKVFKSDNKKEFVEYAVNYYGFNKKDIEAYLYPKKTSSLADFPKDIDNMFFYDDRYLNFSDSTIFFYEEEKLKNQLKIINKSWLTEKKSSKLILSELITRELLLGIKKSNFSESFTSVLIHLDFSCKEMIHTYFNDPNYIIPSQQDIGFKYGLTKSAVSIKFKRFIKKIKTEGEK